MAPVLAAAEAVHREGLKTPVAPDTFAARLA
jgi:guanine deaminase